VSLGGSEADAIKLVSDLYQSRCVQSPEDLSHSRVILRNVLRDPEISSSKLRSKILKLALVNLPVKDASQISNFSISHVYRIRNGETNFCKLNHQSLDLKEEGKNATDFFSKDECFMKPVKYHYLVYKISQIFDVYFSELVKVLFQKP
jgi:hypothetical protein